MNKVFRKCLISALLLFAAFVLLTVATADPAEAEPYTGSIYVDGNEQLDAFISTNGWDGLGTESSPYVIENLEIDATGSYFAIQILNTDKYLEIKNCVLSGSDTFGIRFNNVTNVFLKNDTYNPPSRFTYGIYLWTCSNIVVDGNDFGDADTGVYLDSSDNNRIRFNNVSNCRSTGVYLDNSSGNTIANNTCNDTPLGISLQSESDWNIIDGNICNRSENSGISLDFSANNTVSNNTLYACLTGIALVDAVNNTVFRNDCINGLGGSAAITLDYSHYNTLAKNNCSYNYGGIKLTLSDNNTVRHNTILHDLTTYAVGDGIEIDSSNDNTISYNHCNGYISAGIIIRSSYSDSRFNTVVNNICTSPDAPVLWEVSGIKLWPNGGIVSNNTITGNNCSGNYYGIYLTGSLDNSITNNTCVTNEYGIWFNDRSDWNVVNNNTCSQNKMDGIHLSGSFDCILSNNTCVNNTRVNQGSGIVLDASNNNMICDNNLSYNYVGVRLMYSSLNNDICDNYFSWNTRSIKISGGSNDTLIDGNDIVSSIYGIMVTDEYNAVITGTVINDTVIRDSSYGMYLTYAPGTVVTNSTIAVSTLVGLYAFHSDQLVVIGNNIHSGALKGVEISSSVGSVIADNICTFNQLFGIKVDSFHNGTIANNTFSNSGNGIRLELSNDNIVENNTCSANTYKPDSNTGIWVYASLRNTIANNTCNLNGRSGIYLQSSNNNVLSNNTCDSNGQGQVTHGGIILIYSGDNTLANNSISNNPQYGVSLTQSHGNVLYNNTLRGNGFGIDVSASTNLTISKNEVHESIYGIYLLGADGSDVIGNNCTAASLTLYQTRGIYLRNSPSVKVLNNSCSYNSVGIMNEDSDDVIISGNNCSLNRQSGIELISVLGNDVANNNCTDNGGRGIYLSTSSSNKLRNNTCNGNVDGIYLHSTISVFSAHNIIHNNTCNANRADGISLFGSKEHLSDTTITNNTCNDNRRGVIVSASSSCEIANNTCLGNEIGIWIKTSSNLNTVGNNICSENTQAGIYLSSSNNNTISNNTCDNNGADGSFHGGIVIDHSNDNKLTNNSCSENPRAGMVLYYAQRCVLYNNTLNWNGLGMHTSYSNDLVIVENEIHDSIHGIYLNQATGGDIIGNNCTSAGRPYSQTYGIFLQYTLSVNVLNNSCNYNYVGIMNHDSDDIIISGNNCSLNLQCGIELRYAIGDKVTNNSCTGSSIGITVIASDGNLISNNNCSGNVQNGIFFYNGDSNENVISNNTCNNNGYGMMLDNLIDSRVSNNTCEDNGKAGIRMLYRSKYNVIENNTIVNNGYQLVEDGYGMWSAGIGLAIDGSGEYNWCDGNLVANNTIEGSRLYGLQILNSVGNRVFGNVFMGNNGATSVYDPAHVQAYDDGTNFWNDTASGNLWGDWTSPDAKGDGFVDAVYAIDGGDSKDYYPLAISLVITSPADGFATRTASVDLLGIANSYFGLDQVTWHNAATGESGNCTGTETWNATVPLAAGDNLITVNYTDLSGMEAIATITVVLDLVAPTLNITSPGEGAYVGSSVTVTWTANGTGSDIDHYTVSIESRFSINTTGSSYTINDLTEGPWTVLVSAYDVAGNYLDVPVTFTVDLTAPNVNIDSPADNFLSTSSSVTVTWNGSDTGSGIDHYEVSWGGSTPVSVSNATLTYTFPNLSDGAHLLTVVAVNKVGLTSQDQVAVVVDTGPPSLTITYPAQSSYVTNSDVSVTWAGSDAGTEIAYYTVSMEGSFSINTTGSSYTINDLADGTYTVMVSAYDDLGNYRDEVATFTVDTVTPTLSINSPDEGDMFNVTSVTVTWTTADANPGIVQIKFDTGSWAPAYEMPFVKTELTNGPHTVYVKATDAAGNSVERSRNFTVDTYAPIVTFTSPSNGSLVNTTQVTVVWNASDATSLIVSGQIRVDGGAWADTGTNEIWTFSLEDGTHTIKLVVTDSVGNSANATLNITVDTVVPEATVSPIGDELELGLVVLVEFSERMNTTSVTISVSGVTGAMKWEGNAALFTPSALQFNRVYTVQVSGEDLAGNSMEINWTFSTRSVGNLTGVIVDENGDPVVGANVTVGGELTTITDQDGRFVFLNLSVGTYLVEVEMDGYQPFSFNATVEQGATADSGTLELVPEETADGEDDGGLGFWIYAIIALIVLAVVGAAAFVFLRKK